MNLKKLDDALIDEVIADANGEDMATDPGTSVWEAPGGPSL
jgi:hypothetical protein